MYILGIHNSGPNSSAALIHNGKIICACLEERLIRIKQTNIFPIKSIQFCLQKGGLKIEDIDYFAFGWNAGINASLRYRRGFSDWIRTPMERLSTIPNRILTLYDKKEMNGTNEIFSFLDGNKVNIYQMDHHESHAANVFFLSPFDKAALFTCDFFSEHTTASMCVGYGHHIETYQKVFFPHSLGALYSAFTEFLGFSPESDEWKVMGAAPYGNPQKYTKEFSKLVHYIPGGKFELDLNYFNYYNFDTQGMLSEKAYSLFGPPRKSNDALSQYHFDIAAGLQLITENVLFSILDEIYKRTQQDNLCVSGGIFMNCVFNGKILNRTNFKRLYIPFAPDDSGNSIGAALLLYYKLTKKQKENCTQTSFLGPEWNDTEIESILKKYKIKYKAVIETEKEAVKLLSEGKIIGWFQGKMEFGQRALGNRSILADPRDALMRDKINLAIKYREPFRPFAPAILEENVEEYFQVPSDIRSVPFMEQVFNFKDSVKDKVPAVVHVDGTGRLQTVNMQQNPRFYKLIKEFEKITNIPIVLNTSFNVSGEPIVCSPEDALRTFITSGLDALFMNKFYITKDFS